MLHCILVITTHLPTPDVVEKPGCHSPHCASCTAKSYVALTGLAFQRREGRWGNWGACAQPFDFAARSKTSLTTGRMSSTLCEEWGSTEQMLGSECIWCVDGILAVHIHMHSVSVYLLFAQMLLLANII